MKRRNFKIRFWLCLAVAGIALLVPATAQATTNVVPNPGFEQGGCGSTPVICGWVSNNVMAQANGHSGGASMTLGCGFTGCWSSGGSVWLSASTDRAFCAAIGPGTHPASFWYQASADETVGLGATFFQAPDCTGPASGGDFFSESAAGDGAWHEATGDLVASAATESALFSVSVSFPCEDFCSAGDIFDDLDVEDAVVSDTTPPQTTITSGPTGTTPSMAAAFEFTASEQSTFECSLDDAPFDACASPATYSGLGDGSHTFRVRATDRVGNTDPTPAEQTWTVQVVGDFSIAASPDNLSLQQGAWGTSTIQTTVTSGSAQWVDLSATVQPAGVVRVSFSSTSVTAGNRAMMNVGVGVGTTPGTYTITVTGSGESWTHTTTVTLTVSCCGSDFTIAAHPSALTLAPGSSGTSTIGTTLISGVAQTVELSAVVQPAAMFSVSFAPWSITMGGSSTMTLSVGTAALPGTYTMTVWGTTPDGNAVHHTTVDLIVQPAPVSDFSIAASPSSLSVVQGATRASTIITGVTSGSAQAVSLSATGPPAGTTVDFGPASLTAGAASTMTVSVGSATTPGNYTITVRGTGTSTTHLTTVELTVLMNAPPTGSFTFSCSGLTCTFDGGASSDNDGTIESYRWDFGDGTSGGGEFVQHTYGQPRSYSVGLIVTDNDGATATVSKFFNPISLSARGYKQKGVAKVDLAWSGSSGASFDVYRNGGKIATVQASAYTDSLNTRSSGSYVYKVCTAASSTCSNQVAVNF
jgi:PKD domain